MIEENHHWITCNPLPWCVYGIYCMMFEMNKGDQAPSCYLTKLGGNASMNINLPWNTIIAWYISIHVDKSAISPCLHNISWCVSWYTSGRAIVLAKTGLFAVVSQSRCLPSIQDIRRPHQCRWANIIATTIQDDNASHYMMQVCIMPHQVKVYSHACVP